VGLTGISAAKEADKDDDWHLAFELYGWYAAVKGTSAENDKINMSADDIIDSLNTAFMGSFGAKKKNWIFVVDGIYLNADDDVNPMPGMRANAELTNWIITPFVGYQMLQTKHVDLYLHAGARYLYLETDIELNLSDPLPLLHQKVSESGSNWDGIGGLSGHIKLSENWRFPYYFDIGTGETRLTWQALAAVEYRFDRIDVVAGYRYLSWDFDDDPLLDDMNISGPYAGVKFRF
jgi:hypothetical protein